MKNRITEKQKVGFWAKLKRLMVTDVGALARGLNAGDVESLAERVIVIAEGLTANFNASPVIMSWTVTSLAVEPGGMASTYMRAPSVVPSNCAISAPVRPSTSLRMMAIRCSTERVSRNADSSRNASRAWAWASPSRVGLRNPSSFAARVCVPWARRWSYDRFTTTRYSQVSMLAR